MIALDNSSVSEWVSLLPLNGIGVVGVVMIFAFMMVKGTIVTGAQHKEQLDDKDKRIEYLERLLTKAVELNAENAGTIAKQAAGQEFATHVLEAIRVEWNHNRNGIETKQEH